MSWEYYLHVLLLGWLFNIIDYNDDVMINIINVNVYIKKLK
jgi:hypothetical protein